MKRKHLTALLFGLAAASAAAPIVVAVCNNAGTDVRYEDESNKEKTNCPTFSIYVKFDVDAKAAKVVDAGVAGALKLSFGGGECPTAVTKYDEKVWKCKDSGSSCGYNCNEDAKQVSYQVLSGGSCTTALEYGNAVTALKNIKDLLDRGDSAGILSQLGGSECQPPKPQGNPRSTKSANAKPC